MQDINNRTAVPGGHVEDTRPQPRALAGKLKHSNVKLYLRPARPLPEVPPAFSNLSRAAYAAQYSAAPQDIRRVETFLCAHDLAFESDPLLRSISISGRHKDIDRAFQIRQGSPASVPGDLEDIVTAIVGLDTGGSPTQPGNSTGNANGWGMKVKRRRLSTPADVEGFYGFPTNTSGKGQCVGIIELGGGYRKKDVKAFFDSLDVNPSYRDICIETDGKKGENEHIEKRFLRGYAKWMAGKGQYLQAARPFFEVTMDLSLVGALAPDAEIQMYFGYDTTTALIGILQHALFKAEPRPTVLSMSWGFEERAVLSNGSDIAAAHVINDLFRTAAMMGVTVCCAGGDWGGSNQSEDGFPGQGLDVEFPASCQYALAVGGTTVTKKGKEVAWNTDFPAKGSKIPRESFKHGATGGGYSQIFGRSPWQQGLHEQVHDRRSHMRAMPDIAAVADPQCGMNWRMENQTVPSGGTSAAAPIWAAFVARLNEALDANVGFINPVIYQLGRSNPECFNDVLKGNNKFSKHDVGYYTRSGWDPCTGWGTPRGNTLLEALKDLRSGTSQNDPD